MDWFSIAMFVAVGLAAAHVAHKTSEGGIGWATALGLAVPAALVGGLGAAFAGVEFYGLLGHMLVSMGCTALGFMLWRQLRA